ncbi:MAG: hypothetical protein GX558_01010, partial [Clostridiales bacterium]|nr:hypothetical protein [Clostridiales bacterium]
MRSSKWKLVALALVAALALSGCGMVTIDKEMEDNEPVVIINGETVTRGEARPLYQLYAYFYGQYYTEDSIKDMLLNVYIEDKLLAQKAKEMGLDALTDEEKAEIETAAGEQFESAIVEHWDHAATAEMTEEQARQATIDHLAGEGTTLAALIEDATGAKIKDKVRGQIIKDVAVTDDEVQAKYDELAVSDAEQYAGGGYAFESAVTSGDTVVYYPEGYRTVKHILLKYTDEESLELSDLETELSDAEGEIDALTEALATPAPDATAEPEAADGATPDPAATPAPTMDELTARKADIEQRIAAFKQKAIADRQAKVDEIMQKLNGGTSFDDLIAEYGEDPGMTQEPGMTKGYYVSAQSVAWDPAFTAGAMALQSVGEVGSPIAAGSNSGIHIIRYHADVTPGQVPL